MINFANEVAKICYSNRMKGKAFRIAAKSTNCDWEDLLQETLFYVLREQNKWDSEKYSIEQWITMRLWFTYKRWVVTNISRQKHAFFISLNTPKHIDKSSGVIVEYIDVVKEAPRQDKIIEAKEVLQRIKTLPERQQKAIAIAINGGESTHSDRTYLHRARKTLKEEPRKRGVKMLRIPFDVYFNERDVTIATTKVGGINVKGKTMAEAFAQLLGEIKTTRGLEYVELVLDEVK